MSRSLTLLLWLTPALAAAQPPSYVELESGQVRPLALSADGDTLYAVNTPDARLEIFDLTGPTPRLSGSVMVGLEPVAVAVESAARVWVVNHVSDSVSVVDVASTPPRVVRTLHVGDEPRDLVFAGPGRRRAFVTTAHRGQNTPWPRGEYDTPGVGRADVWVFDADALGAPLGGTPLTVVRLFGDVPRALAVSPDGARVYAAVFLSGNRTATVSEGAVCDGGPTVGPCDIEGTTYPGGLPAPVTDHSGAPGPEVGLIVRDTGDGWRDELGRDWSPAIRFDLPDEDVFEIDAMAATPSATRSFRGVGTVLYGMAVNPVSGALYVANTEAMNDVRFEGAGAYVRDNDFRPGLPPSVRGHLHEARVTVIDDGAVTPRGLNPHLDYAAPTQPTDARWRTLAQPTALAVTSDGATLYVAALGSSAIGVLDAAALESGRVDDSLARSIHLRDPYAAGPTGLVLDEARGRLYVLTRFDDAVVTVDLERRVVIDRVRMHSPEPAHTVIGRPVLYDALATSSTGEASCGSCHVFGDLDGLAWDLGDPDGDVLANPNPVGPIGSRQPFSPLKGPMTTQTFRGLADHGPMHWRGDRTGGHTGGDPLDERAAFEAFDVAFAGLLGRDEGALDAADMRRFAEFAIDLYQPPNPIRQLDNSLRADEERGRRVYFDRDGIDSVATCNGCHVLDRARGFFGSDGRTTFEGETQEMKVPHLRNAYQKVGMFGMPSVPFNDDGLDHSHMGPQVRGFGFLHDGSTDTLLRFFHATVFTGFASERERDDMEAFVMAFDNTLPPIVGQQVTVDADSDAAAYDRALLLAARARTSMIWPGGASTTECDLVVRGVVDGEARSYLLEPDGMLHPDRATGPSTTLAALAARAMAGEAVLTATCVPPGSGRRMAHDRDEDGVRDGDERDLGTDPADRALVDIPPLDVRPPDAPPLPDGGVPARDAGADGGRLDAGAADAGSPDAGPAAPPDGGCGCRAAGETPSRAWAIGLLALVLAAWRPRRQSGA